MARAGRQSIAGGAWGLAADRYVQGAGDVWRLLWRAWGGSWGGADRVRLPVIGAACFGDVGERPFDELTDDLAPHAVDLDRDDDVLA